MASHNSSDFFSFVLETCSPYKDLSMSIAGNNSNVLEIKSRIFYLSPCGDPAGQFQVVLAKALQDQQKLVISVLNKTVHEMSWNPEATDEMRRTLRTLSFYGDRHLFCPGLSVSQVSRLTFGVQSKPPERILLEHLLPYEHYRAIQCAFYFQRAKNYRNKNDPTHLCDACMYVKHHYSARSRDTQSPPESRRRKHQSPSSKCNVRYLSPESRKIRLEGASKQKKQKST